MKRLILGALIILGLYVIGEPVSALKTNLVSSDEINSTSIYELLALPPVDSLAIQVRMSLTGGEIVKVEVADENLLSLPVCEGGSSFTANTICVELATKGGVVLESNKAVLLITVKHDSQEEVVFTSSPDFAYVSKGNDIVAEDGTILSVSKPLVTQEPPAPTVDIEEDSSSNSLPFILLIGILVVLVGAFVAIIFFTDKKAKIN